MQQLKNSDMTQPSSSTTRPVHPVSLGARMLQGAVPALILIAAFLLAAGASNPAWPKFWQLKPLLIVPLAGAMGGVFFYMMDHLRYQGGWRKYLAYLISIVVYCIGIWLGTVLGLNGTLWN